MKQETISPAAYASKVIENAHFLMSPSASFLELVPSGRTNKYYVPTNSNNPLFQCSETTLRSFTPPPAEPVTPDLPLSRPINVSSTSCPEVSPMDTVSSALPKCIASKNIY